MLKKLHLNNLVSYSNDLMNFLSDKARYVVSLERARRFLNYEMSAIVKRGYRGKSYAPCKWSVVESDKSRHER